MTEVCYLLHLVLILSLYSNCTCLKINQNNKLHKREPLENPCYLNGYLNPSREIKGTGNYPFCYFVLSHTMPKTKLRVPVQVHESNKTNTTTFIFGEEFEDISEYLQKSETTLPYLIEAANSTCALNFEEFLTIKNSTFFDICYKLTLDILIIENLIHQLKLPKNTELKVIFHHYHSNSNYDYSLNFSEVPKVVVIVLTTLLLIFIALYIFKPYLIILFQHKFLDEDLNARKVNRDQIDSVMISIPVKTFILNNFKEKIHFETQNGPLDLKRYRDFFLKLLHENENLRRKVKETLNHRNYLKSSIIFGIFFIFLIIILSISTTILLSYVRAQIRGMMTFIYMFTSGVLMSFLVYESLKVISYYDSQKFYYSNIYSKQDKHFLEHEYIEYGLNIEIF